MIDEERYIKYIESIENILVKKISKDISILELDMLYELLNKVHLQLKNRLYVISKKRK